MPTVMFDTMRPPNVCKKIGRCYELIMKGYELTVFLWWNTVIVHVLMLHSILKFVRIANYSNISKIN